MKRPNIPLSFLLVVAATTVAISRYMVVAGATEHYTITGDLWNWVNIACGAAMAILEGVSVWYCWRAWSAAKPCAERNVLLILIVTTVISLYGSIMPTIVAGASGQPFATVVTGEWMFAWATCVTVAPFAIMSANAIAGMLTQVAPVATTPKEVAPVAAEVASTQSTTQKLINLLQADATMSRADIATALGITPQAVSAQLRKLEKAGSIRRNGHIEVVQK